MEIAGSDRLLRAPEIVHHQETAAQQILAQSLDFGVAQTPPTGLGRIDPGIVEEPVVGEAKMQWRRCVDPCEALDAH
jgi:hypothetical protein